MTTLTRVQRRSAPIQPRSAPVQRRRARAAGPSGWFAAPALLVFVCFAVAPLVGVLGLSFTAWDGIGAISWAGTESWATVLSDPVTGNALAVTAKVMFFSFIVQAPISLLLGVFIAGHQKYRALLAVLYFLPLLLSSAAVAIAYKALLDPNFGLSAGLNIPALAQDWLGNPDLVLFVVIFVIAWQFVPFHTLIYQGGVRQIPASLYEAADIDGASRVQQFFHITMPQLKYTIITSSTLMIVGSLTYFDLVFVLTGGGPGYTTRLLPLQMYLTGFQANDMGAASALGVILVVVGLVIALVLQRLGGKDRRASQTEGV